ncbi:MULTISPECIES: nitroreductase family protein [Reichenbachiella]|uniref:nitroreductase family protein n=1 Tax=Reichenbachiella TaxID=156993 RepID=UPI000E6D4837|nr:MULTISPECIES: nitroreductase family protein [Reichenbachiella]MBU2912522.1 nitroreductase family protein [Reichenbachiella agariperforans]RJE72618.1 nitroreductase [Reichenbachiella sp. MSK19-1]
MKTKDVNGFRHVKYDTQSYAEDEMRERSKAYYEWLDKRRSVREISDRSFPKEVLDNIIRAASTAPSGAHKQPWTFCVVTDSGIKSKIREAAEKEEYESYQSRMSERWLDDLKPIGTDWKKPFLETAPYLVVLFKRVFERDASGVKSNNYYVNESVGIAAGMFISAVHHAGLVTLTHTPSPMNFLSDILERPDNERAFLVLPVGYPEDEVYVPDFDRKLLSEVAVYY